MARAALEPLRAAYSEFGSLRLARRANLNRAFLAALDAGDAAKALEIAREVRRQEEEDEKVNNAHYRRMNEVYQDFREKTQAEIDKIRSAADAAEKTMAQRVTPAAN